MPSFRRRQQQSPEPPRPSTPVWAARAEPSPDLAYVVPAEVAGPRRRRDRRGRGVRGPLIPPSVPAHLSRSDRFDGYVLAAVERVEAAWGDELRGTEFAVETVPPSDPHPWEPIGVRLGRCHPAESGQPARIVVFRRPIESRATGRADLADMVSDVVVQQVAELLGRRPEEIDPMFGREDP
ncbi:metallopeptidase family protein [Paraoerskovia marina]|uniref:metallopeptidase family protein n=1 Tax=Paraoerskovia marina TaxID=545619 RepID=UPI0031F60777